MTRWANFSGKEVVSILEKQFGFFFVSIKGSHVKMRKEVNSRNITVIIPNHYELAPGTLRGILRQADVAIVDFLTAAGRL